MKTAKQISLALGVLVMILGVAGSVIARQGMSDEERMARVKRLMAAPNPLTPSESMWIEELTYMEVRDRIAGGATIAIIPTGGVEENGPFIATGKHNVILRAVCPALARELGNALCAPIVPFVPEGDIEPPSGAMFFPGTFSVRDETYEALLDDIASSLKQSGFREIVFIGDSGGNQRGMEAVARRLNGRWAGSGVRAHFIGEYYTPGWEDTETYTQEVLGVRETKNDGHHDDIWVTAIMMVTDPESVRYDARLKANLASINGVDISDLDKTVELGRKMVEFRARQAAAVIRKAVHTE